ncbi:hypothetical protein E2562_022520 [Oryza meyeriana var. granulata]|uniref:Uncharacterized protein n=1 Tax=Oryza meyeriana var. granulata TaxID=110450 RepID=A0A6G1BND1_9ORYZ|nr:hypothetical protein E2562_022520 [Oryza meyeriana var. granulata]
MEDVSGHGKEPFIAESICTHAMNEEMLHPGGENPCPSSLTGATAKPLLPAHWVLLQAELMVMEAAEPEL